MRFLALFLVLCNVAIATTAAAKTAEVPFAMTVTSAHPPGLVRTAQMNVPNQPIGAFTTDLAGEPITIQRMVFFVQNMKDNPPPTATNVSLVNASGAVVAGPVDVSVGPEGEHALVFTDTVTIPQGKTTYTLKARLMPTPMSGQLLVVTTDPSKNWTGVRGQVSGNTITLTNPILDLGMVEAKIARLTISVAQHPVSQFVAPGATSFVFANYQFDASQSSEDVRFSSIPLLYTYNGKGGGVYGTELTNCQLWDGSTPLNTGANIVNPRQPPGGHVTFTLDQQFVIPKGTVKTLALRANLSQNAPEGASYSWSIGQPEMAVTGCQSGNDVSEEIRPSDGQTMTVGPNPGPMPVAIAPPPMPSQQEAWQNTLLSLQLTKMERAFYEVTQLMNEPGVTATDSRYIATNRNVVELMGDNSLIERLVLRDQNLPMECHTIFVQFMTRRTQLEREWNALQQAVLSRGPNPQAKG